MTQRTEKTREITKGVRQLAKAHLAQVGEFSAAKVPRREAVRLSPRAKLNCLPLNQRAMAAMTATFNVSAPAPKIKRPVAMTESFPAETVMAGPMKQSTPKIISDLRRPMRSIRMPPSRVVKIGGML